MLVREADLESVGAPSCSMPCGCARPSLRKQGGRSEVHAPVRLLRRRRRSQSRRHVRPLRVLVPVAQPRRAGDCTHGSSSRRGLLAVREPVLIVVGIVVVHSRPGASVPRLRPFGSPPRRRQGRRAFHRSDRRVVIASSCSPSSSEPRLRRLCIVLVRRSEFLNLWRWKRGGRRGEGEHRWRRGGDPAVRSRSPSAAVAATATDGSQPEADPPSRSVHFRSCVPGRHGRDLPIRVGPTFDIAALLLVVVLVFFQRTDHRARAERPQHSRGGTTATARVGAGASSGPGRGEDTARCAATPVPLSRESVPPRPLCVVVVVIVVIIIVLARGCALLVEAVPTLTRRGG